MLLWSGTLISTMGYQMYVLAIPLIIYDLTQSALAMSMMRAIEFLPNIFIGMIAGVLVDRLNRKRILQWTSSVQILAISGIVFLLVTGDIHVWHLYVLGFLLSVASYTFGNAHHAVMPKVVATNSLTEANAKLSFIQTLTQTIGPGLAGSLLLISSFTSILTIYIGSLLFVLISVSFLKLPHTKGKTRKEQSFVVDIKEGVQELFKNKILLTPTLTVLFLNLASSLVIGVLVFFAKDQLGATSAQIGLMFSISAMGGFLGALCISPIRKRFGRGKIFTYCLVIDMVGLLVLLFAPVWWAIGIALAIRTLSTTISNIVYFTIRQEFTPNHMLGRVAGTSSMLMKLTLPVGLFIAGLWAEWFSIRILFFISFLIVLLLFFKPKLQY